MALSQTSGNLTVTTSELNLFASQTTLQHYACWIFLNSMGASDVVEIKVYINDPQGTPAERLYFTAQYSGVQDDPAIFVPYVPTNSFRVTLKRIAGTITSADWARLDLP